MLSCDASPVVCKDINENHSTNLSDSFGDNSGTNESTQPSNYSSEGLGSQTMSEPQANTQILTNRIQEYVLKEVKLKLDHGQSQHVAS